MNLQIGFGLDSLRRIGKLHYRPRGDFCLLEVIHMSIADMSCDPLGINQSNMTDHGRSHIYSELATLILTCDTKWCIVSIIFFDFCREWDSKEYIFVKNTNNKHGSLKVLPLSIFLISDILSEIHPDYLARFDIKYPLTRFYIFFEIVPEIIVLLSCGIHISILRLWRIISLLLESQLFVPLSCVAYLRSLSGDKLYIKRAWVDITNATEFSHELFF